VALPFIQGVHGNHAHGVPVAACSECNTQTASAAVHTFNTLNEVAEIGHLLSVTLIDVSSPEAECLSNPLPFT
jgi:hypothetical protein